MTYAEDVPEVARSKPMVRFPREAAAEVPRLARGVNARDVVETVLAMYLMQEQEPRRFMGDSASRTQMVRRVRGLMTLNADTWVDPCGGKGKARVS
jgi:hypothetical protein